jgi:penicillin-binding protein 1A
VTLAAMAFVIGAAGVGAVVWTLSGNLPDLEQLKEYAPRLTTRLLDRNGELIAELFTERRMQASLDRIPQQTIDAILTTEDARFWNHWGVDMVRIFGAALVDITTLSLKQGASTLTQQLARDLYLNRERTFGRKIRETLTAIQIERHFSKREILEMYLTQIYFGHGAFGVASAAGRYFNKPVEQLTLAESALLAALPKAPSNYSPFYHPDAALARRNLILEMMWKGRKVTTEAYQAAVREPLQVNPAPELGVFGTAPYFTEMIRQKLSKEAERLGFDYLGDGLTVQTTLDARLQRFAELAVDSQMTDLQHSYRVRFVNHNLGQVSRALYGDETAGSWARIREDTARVDSAFPTRAVLQVALVALDPRTGDILAMIGGRDFAKSKFNRAVQAVRQPGSVFKPFVYTAAIDNGYPPSFELLNQDVVLVMYDGTRWAPQNYDGSRGGLTTLREAIRRSLNLVTVRLVQEVVPPATVVKYTHQMGIMTPIDAVDAIALGSSGIIPIEATAAYAVFANQGIWCEPRGLVSITDRFGTQIAEYTSEQRVALPKETAYIMTNMLETAIRQGTGASAYSRFGWDKTAAGKTGTTNDFTDAWFIGFTPRLICGVWVGLDDPAETIGKGASGAVIALPMWAKFMKMAYDSLGLPDEEFEIPEGVMKATICNETKKLASAYCPVKVEEIFRAGTEPTEECRKHRRMPGL